MVYCSNCGEKLADDANFCPKCGTKTPTGRASNVVYPASEVRDAFYAVGAELETAFNLAAKDMHAAIQRARDNLQSKNETVVCPKCGSKNPVGSTFCNNCGTKLTST